MKDITKINILTHLRITLQTSREDRGFLFALDFFSARLKAPVIFCEAPRAQLGWDGFQIVSIPITSLIRGISISSQSQFSFSVGGGGGLLGCSNPKFRSPRVDVNISTATLNFMYRGSVILFLLQALPLKYFFRPNSGLDNFFTKNLPSPKS